MKIEVLVRESRSMVDLALTMKKLREEGISDLLIIDSISHVWEDVVESYKRRVGRLSLQFQDWGIVKPTWKKQFSDPFVTDPYHILMTGRAGYEYDYERNEDTGKKEVRKTGIKMKVEGETACEPDMLVLMERYEELVGREKRVWREATIVKDRSTVLDGKTFQDPTFEDFAPSVKVMLSGGKKAATQAEADSAALFKTEEERQEWLRDKKKALEEIEGYLVSVWPSVAGHDKQMKAEALYQGFGTRSWTAIEELAPEGLRTGYDKIVAFVEELTSSESVSNGKRSGNSHQVRQKAA